jgi:nicotinate-nucleotide adenylyltransferase
MKKIGVFGGTFDPIHFGHLHLAISLSEAHKLDCVFWVPAHANPLKEACDTPSKHRLAMLKLALRPIPSFKIMDFELKRKSPSYTVDTLRALKKRFPDARFHLLIGDDILPHFAKWKEPLEVIQLAAPLVGARRSHWFPAKLKLDAEIVDAFKRGWTPVPLMEISATDIRNRLNERKFCGHLVPAKVLDYIHEHHLYSTA